MRDIVSTAARACASILCVPILSALVSPVAAQPAIPKNPKIDISYVEPSNQKYKAIYGRLTRLKALETLQQFLSPLKLPSPITIKVDQCDGALTVPYKPESATVTLCYEYIWEIEANVPGQGAVNFGRGRPQLTATQTIIGAFVQEALQQTAYPVLDILEVPVWGRLDEAADNVAGFIMLEFGDDVAWTTIAGTAWFLAQRGLLGSGYFTDTARLPEAQRFYNYLCLAYGRNGEKYQFLVDTANLHPERAKYCAQDYRRLRYSFRQTIMPHVDQPLLKQVQAKKDWLPKSLQ
jgi:hypothetical protein